jgi:hypothetical protein
MNLGDMKYSILAEHINPVAYISGRMRIICGIRVRHACALGARTCAAAEMILWNDNKPKTQDGSILVAAKENDVTETELVITYASLVVPWIAGTFTLLGLVVSKEQKVSEFRQTWIDALREEIAEFVSHALWFQAEVHQLVVSEARDRSKFLDRVRESYLAVTRSASKIRLRLNPSESNSKAVLQCMRRVEGCIERSLSGDECESIMPHIVSVQEAAAILLKSQWERVKEGERDYRRAKRAAQALIIILGVLMIVSALGISYGGQAARWWRDHGPRGSLNETNGRPWNLTKPDF